MSAASLLKMLWEKEKLLMTSNCSFFPQHFLPFWKNSCHFSEIAKLLSVNSSVWKSLKFFVWERFFQVYGFYLQALVDQGHIDFALSIC